MDGGFAYGWRDQVDDALTKHENVVAGIQHTGGVVSGGVEAAGGVAVAIAGCATTGPGCVLAVGGGSVLVTDGVSHGYASAQALAADHQYQSGRNVIDSFSPATYGGDVSPSMDIAVGSAIIAGETAAAGALIRIANGADNLLDVALDLNRTQGAVGQTPTVSGTPGLRGSGAVQGGEVVPNKIVLRQTGGGSGYIDPADKIYDAIRASETDVSTIAANTGIKPQNIQKVKDHVFYNEHLLDRYVDLGEPAVVARFDSNPAQAELGSV